MLQTQSAPAVTSPAPRRPPDPTAPLRDALAPSGYAGVEPHAGGFRGRVPFLKSPMPTRPSAREAALDLVAFWHAQFGPRWEMYYRKRLAPAWRAERLASGRWRLVVYVRGWEWRPTAATFASRAAVGDYYRRWARGRYGRLAWREVRQAA